MPGAPKSSNDSFCPTNNPKCKNIQFTKMQHKEKPEIFTSKKLILANVWHFCLRSDPKDSNIKTAGVKILSIDKLFQLSLLKRFGRLNNVHDAPPYFPLTPPSLSRSLSWSNHADVSGAREDESRLNNRSCCTIGGQRSDLGECLIGHHLLPRQAITQGTAQWAGLTTDILEF